MISRIVNGSLRFVNGSTYLLREGGTVTLRLVTGYAEPYNDDIVETTRVTVWCPTGNVYVTENGNGLKPITPQIPAPKHGPFQEGSERRTVAEYVGQPGGTIEMDVHLQGDPLAYSDEVVYCKVELLRANGTVYADNGFDVGGVRCYPSVRLRLVTNAGRMEAPEGPEKWNVDASGAKAVALSWTAPVPATNAKLWYNNGISGQPLTLITDSAPVGENAGFWHGGLTADTDYHYYIQFENDAGTSGDPAYLGMARTAQLPPLPDAPVITSTLTPNPSTLVVTFDRPEKKRTLDGKAAGQFYRIYGRIASLPDEPENYVQIDIAGSQSSTSVDWLVPGDSYTVYMTTVNDAGESERSASVTVTMPDEGGAPVAPTNLNVETSQFTTQTVTWDMDESVDIAGFGLYYSTDQSTWTAVQDFAPLSATTRSWVQTDLALGTTYYWRLFSFRYVDGVLTRSVVVEADEATSAAPAQPDAVAGVGLLSLNNHTISAHWEFVDDNAPVKGYKVYRSDDDITYTLIATVAPNINFYADRALQPGTVYYYRVDTVGYSGDVTGPKASASTLVSSYTVHPVSPFTLHPDSRNRIVEVAGRAIITSDRDRPVVRVGESWYKMGLRPVRGSVGLSKTSGGALDNGVYTAYIVLVRGETRSVPSAASSAVTISDSDNRLVVTPPLNGDSSKVECRDIGYDINGDLIDGADSWELYIAEENEERAYRVARLPLDVEKWEDTPSSGTYTLPAGLTTASIFDGTRRPMEIQLESSLPPSCWECAVKENRVVMTGEVDLAPTAAEVTDGAKLTITAGQDYFTVTDWDATDACVYKRLVLDNVDTGWEIYDYDHDTVDPLLVTKCYIRHSDPSINAAGFDGESGDYTDFKLEAPKGRVYFSAFFSGAALGQLVYSPETFPPLTIAETQFFPDDNGEVLCLVPSGEILLAGKPDKWVAMSGGDEPDVPMIDTRAMSLSGGVNASFSVAQDSNGYVYYLGDSGPFRVSGGGVEKVNIRYGVTRAFGDVFDLSSVPNGKGAWFSREDWYVVTGLNLVGRVGNRDGFVLDVKNGALMPISFPYEMTHIKEYKSTSGDYQLLFGADDGRMGYAFKTGLFVDAVDYTGTYPYDDAQPITAEFTTGILDTEHALTPDWIQPRIKTRPRGAGFWFRFEIDDKYRCDDPGDFTAADWVEFSTDDVSDHVRIASGRYDQMQFRLLTETIVNSPDAWFEIKELPLRVVIRHAS